MGKHPIDRDRHRDPKETQRETRQAAQEYARVEREHSDPMTDPKVRAMARTANREETTKQADKYARLEREQADPITDPKVRAMTKSARTDEDKSLTSRIKKFLNIDRQPTDS